MNNSDASMTDRQSLAKLTQRLLVVLVCSLLPPMGLYLLVGAAFSSSSGINFLIVGMLFIFGSPILLGLYFRPSMRGIRSGFLGAVCLLIIYLSYARGLLEPPLHILEIWFPGNDHTIVSF